MAYVFDQINSLLSPDQNQSNVFSQGQPGQQQAGQPQGQTTGAVLKTAGATGSQTANSGSSLSPNAPTSTNPSSQVSAEQIQVKNQGLQPASNFASGLQNSLNMTQQGLQNEANAYSGTGAALGSQGVPGQDTIKQAIGGDKTAMGSLQTRLAGTSPKVQAFQNNVTTDMSPQLGLLNTSQGLQTMAAQQAPSAEYTSGQAALDASLAYNNPDFANTRSALNLQQQAINNQLADLQNNAQNREQTAADNAYAAGNQQITGALQTNLSGLQQQASDAMAAYNKQAQTAANPALLGGPATAVYNQLMSTEKVNPNNTALLPYITAAYKQSTGQALTPNEQALLYYAEPLKGGKPQVTASGMPALVDVSKFQTTPGQMSDPNQFYTQDTANQFNNIATLLNAPTRVQGAAALPTAATSIDQQAYQKALLDAATAAQKAYIAPSPNGGPILDNVPTPMTPAAQQAIAQAEQDAKNPVVRQQLAQDAKDQAAGKVLPGVNNQPPSPPPSGPAQRAPAQKSNTAGSPIVMPKIIQNAGQYIANRISPVLSDKNAKTEIREVGPAEIHAFLGSLEPKAYAYKDESVSPGKNIGVMAQDMEKSPVGAAAVGQDGDLKTIDYTKLFPAIVAALADTHDRISQLEQKRG